MSYEHIARLTSVQEEYEAARLAMEHLEREWFRLHSSPDLLPLSLARLRRGLAGLEATYIVRLFSLFEAILRDFLPRRVPSEPDRRNAYDLINRCSSQRRIPVTVRDGVQAVREFRNQAVHTSGKEFEVISFVSAPASLNTFLSWLP